jgi:predicted nucleotide-binding protein with TIR-like domain
LSAARGSVTPSAAAAAPTGKKIFVVHGHDREALDQLELVLRRFGLEPFILQNAANARKPRDYLAVCGVAIKASAGCLFEQIVAIRERPHGLTRPTGRDRTNYADDLA